MAKDNQLPEGAWFAIGAIIGAMLAVFVSWATSIPLPFAILAVLVGSFLFGGLAVVFRKELLLMFLP